MSPQTDLDRINRNAWVSSDALREFTRDKTWSDPGEASAFAFVADRCAGSPLLDIGIGAGRTIPLMQAISDDYIGIDYTEKLLGLARERYPAADLRHMDARNMSTLPSDHYGLAAFSWNGIDCVDYTHRVDILKEMYRVLRPGGYALFSSHNRDGPGFRESLWQLLPRLTANPLRLGWRMLRTMRRLPPASVNYLRHVRHERDFDGYSIKTAAAHNFGIVIVYTTLREQRRQLGEVGFVEEAVFGSDDGALIAPETITSPAFWLHFIARKPPAEG